MKKTDKNYKSFHLMCPAAAKAALATAATVATTGRDMATRRGGGGEQWGLDRSEERD